MPQRSWQQKVLLSLLLSLVGMAQSDTANACQASFDSVSLMQQTRSLSKRTQQDSAVIQPTTQRYTTPAALLTSTTQAYTTPPTQGYTTPMAPSSATAVQRSDVGNITIRVSIPKAQPGIAPSTPAPPRTPASVTQSPPATGTNSHHDNITIIIAGATAQPGTPPTPGPATVPLAGGQTPTAVPSARPLHPTAASPTGNATTLPHAVGSAGAAGGGNDIEQKVAQGTASGFEKGMMTGSRTGVEESVEQHFEAAVAKGVEAGIKQGVSSAAARS